MLWDDTERYTAGRQAWWMRQVVCVKDYGAVMTMFTMEELLSYTASDGTVRFKLMTVVKVGYHSRFSVVSYLCTVTACLQDSMLCAKQWKLWYHS